MSDPASHDDDWNDLARELGLEKGAAPAGGPAPAGPLHDLEGADDPEAEPVGEERPAGGHYHPADADATDADADDAEGGESGSEDEGGPEGEGQADEGQPGTGRKRRRRRRRRKKGAGLPGAEGAAAPLAEPAAEGADQGADEGPAAADFEEAAAGDEAEEVGAGAAGLVAEEDTASEVLRELIATWTVPSWDDIVGGLYRPER